MRQIHITYRRTGGVLALLVVAALGAAALVFTLAAAIVTLVVGLVAGTVLLIARALLPASWARRSSRRASSSRHDTIEGTVVARQELDQPNR